MGLIQTIHFLLFVLYCHDIFKKELLTLAAQARSACAAARRPTDGAVFVVGGWDGDQALTSAERFECAGKVVADWGWRAAPPVTHPRCFLGAAATADGQALCSQHFLPNFLIFRQSPLFLFNFYFLRINSSISLSLSLSLCQTF